MKARRLDSNWGLAIAACAAAGLVASGCGDDGGPVDGMDAGPMDGSTDGGEDAGPEDAGADGGDAGPPERVGDVVVNEFVFNHRELDDYEYIEVHGDASTDLSVVSVLVLEGDIDSVSASPGVIENVIPVGTTDADGLWHTGFLERDTLENGSQTALVVQGFSGAELDDLDPDDDGTLDAMPWDFLLDAVGVDDGGEGDFTYAGSAVLTPDFDGEDFTVGGASRLPDGTDTDAPDDWTRNDFDGAGIGDLEPGTPIDTEALNTPGTPNEAAEAPAADAIINEWVADHVGADDHEYVEVLGDPDTDLSSLSVVVIEGDDPGLGLVDGVLDVGTTDANGYWVSSFSADELENGTKTLLLVQFLEVAGGFDVDTDDDGTMDEAPWFRIVDAVSVTDGDAGDMTHSDPVLAPDFDGGSTTVGGASRIPDGTDTDAVGDWTRNHFDGDGLTDVGSGTASGSEAVNTPGEENALGSD